MTFLIYKKLLFLFLSDWFGKFLNKYPSQGRLTALDIYLDASRRGFDTTIHLPLRGKLYNNAAFSDSYPVFPIYFEAGIARRTRQTERGRVTEASVRDDGKEEHQVFLPNTPCASLADRASLVNVYRRLRDDLQRVSCLLFLQSILVTDTSH